MKRVRAFQIELEFENVGFKGEGKTEVPGEKPLGERERTDNTDSTYIWRRRQDSNPRAALLGGERLKEQHEGVKNTCRSSHIHFLWLFLLVHKLLNERVEI